MSRFRLRFLLQEFDLPQGETLVGRSPECQVTIDDPLVSRHHAKIILDGQSARLFDLGSRNGVRLNGEGLRGSAAALADGDRIRIGTQELVFCRIDASRESSNRRTGFLRHCGRCRMPYPEEVIACPACGSTEIADEDTFSGIVGESKQNWTLALILEVLEKALSLGRELDVERLMRKASASVEARLEARALVDRRQLDALADAATRAAELDGTVTWARWMVNTYVRLAVVPPTSAVRRMGALPDIERERLADAVRGLVEAVHDAGGTMTNDEVTSLHELERLDEELGRR